MTIKDKVKHAMGLDRGKQAGDESGGIAHAYPDDRAGEIGGPEVGATGEGRTTGHGSGATTSGATIGVAGLSAGNSGIHPGHRAALAKIDAEEAAKKRPAPVVEEPVKEPVKEIVVEKPVVKKPVVERVSEPVYTSSTTPVHLSPVGDIPTTVPAGARVAGHPTIISGPHNPHMESQGIEGSGLSGTPVLGSSGAHHSTHTASHLTGLSSGSGFGQGAQTGYGQGAQTGYGQDAQTGQGHGAQTDSNNQQGIVGKVASAVGLGGGESNQQRGSGTGSTDPTSGYDSGNTGRSSQGSGAPHGVQADYPSSGATYGTQSSTGHTSTGGHGVNDNTNYGGNSGASGVTDSKGNQLSGNPASGTDGNRIGGSAV